MSKKARRLAALEADLSREFPEWGFEVGNAGTKYINLRILRGNPTTENQQRLIEVCQRHWPYPCLGWSTAVGNLNTPFGEWMEKNGFLMDEI